MAHIPPSPCTPHPVLDNPTAHDSESTRSETTLTNAVRQIYTMDRGRVVLLQAQSISLLTSIRFALDFSSALGDFIVCQRELLRFYESGHDDFPMVTTTTAMHNLGAALLLRYSEYGDPDDLDNALELLQQNVRKWEGVDTEWHAQAAENLACALLLSYRDNKDSTQLQAAARLLANIPQGLSKRTFRAPDMYNDCYKRLHISYPPAALRILSWRARDNIDWVKALDRSEQHMYHANRAGSMKERFFAAITYAALLRIRFMQGDYSAIDRSLALLHDAMQISHLCPQYRAVALSELALLYLTPRNPLLNISLAVKYLLEALRDEQCRAERRMVMALEVFGYCVSEVLSISMKTWSRTPDYYLLIEAYKAAMYLLQRNASIAAWHPSSRMRMLFKFKSLTSRAAAHTIALGFHALAVEFLEIGRSLLWSYTNSDVRDACTFRSTRFSPERSAKPLPGPQISRSTDNDHFIIEAPPTALQIGARRTVRRQLIARFQHGLARVYEGPPPSACSGLPSAGVPLRSLSLVSRLNHPVIILTASGQLCQALVITDTYQRPRRVVFSGVTEQWLNELACRMRRTHIRTRMASQRGIKIVRIPSEEDAIQDDVAILHLLWSKVMKPLAHILTLDLLRAQYFSDYMSDPTSYIGGAVTVQPPLADRAPTPRSRVFLYPTGVFTLLPLHAAGDHPHASFADQFLVSYTPTLGALAKAQDSLKPIPRKECKILLAAVPQPAYGEHLPFAEQEASVISSLSPNATLAEQQESSPHDQAISSSRELLSSIAGGDASILHLACHGVQDAQDPFSSGFMMKDRLVTIREMMQVNTDGSQAFFAFLSACDTARGDMKQPDQAVCLSTAMLLMGFKSIIATLWSMDDIDGPFVARIVYSKLFGGKSKYLDPDAIPCGLDEAVSAMKAMGLPPSRWACYVHVGV